MTRKLKRPKHGPEREVQGAKRNVRGPRLAGALLCFLVLVGCGREQTTSAAPQQSPAASGPAGDAPQAVETVQVLEKKLDRTLRLPGELQPYEAVALYAKIPGFVETITVDRGSHVRRGELLVQTSAPELASRHAEAAARLEAVRAQRAEAQAKLASDQGTFERLKAAAETPGAVAGNDVLVAQKTADASRARVAALDDGERAARAAAQSVEELQKYLRIVAPFDGTITERNAHPGTLVGPTGTPMLRLEQHARLRLVVAVPEADAAAIARGARVAFTVPAYPGETFQGTIRRIPGSLDPKTRSMPVEMDVANTAGRLAPGMYPEVVWPVRRPRASLMVPPSAVVATTERVFVVRLRDGKAEWVDVKRGAGSDDLVEVYGNLRAGDTVVRRASDEIRPGTAIVAKSQTGKN